MRLRWFHTHLKHPGALTCLAVLLHQRHSTKCTCDVAPTYRYTCSFSGTLTYVAGITFGVQDNGYKVGAR